MEEYETGHFEFAFRDIEGTVTMVSFDAETWPEALNKFVYFLRGCSFQIDAHEILVDGMTPTEYVEQFN